MDDVHTELEGSKQLLIQLKYTVQKQKNDTPKNLTTLDVDFWKTLSNWAKVISDDEAERHSVQSQLEFVNRTEFMLASNKSDNTANLVLSAIRKFHKGEISHEDLLEEVGKVKARAKGKYIVGYIEDVESLSSEVSKIFFKNIRFDLGCDDIIKSCKDSILERFIDHSKVDEVFSSLDSQIRADNFGLVSSKKKIIITYDDFREKYRIHFDKARNSRLEVKRHFEMPKQELSAQHFIKQLIDIGDVRADEIDRISTLFYHQLLARNSVDGWEREGVITSLDVEDLEGDAVTSWDNKHRRAFRNDVSEEDINQVALDVVDKLREEKLSVAGQEMDRPFSNGEYYDLCERGEIGWRNDWRERY
jgi:hypothetical protein